MDHTYPVVLSPRYPRAGWQWTTPTLTPASTSTVSASSSTVMLSGRRVVSKMLTDEGGWAAVAAAARWRRRRCPGRRAKAAAVAAARSVSLVAAVVAARLASGAAPSSAQKKGCREGPAGSGERAVPIRCANVGRNKTGETETMHLGDKPPLATRQQIVLRQKKCELSRRREPPPPIHSHSPGSKSAPLRWHGLWSGA